jgi:hypothetical protein
LGAQDSKGISSGSCDLFEASSVLDLFLFVIKYSGYYFQYDTEQEARPTFFKQHPHQEPSKQEEWVFSILTFSRVCRYNDAAVFAKREATPSHQKTTMKGVKYKNYATNLFYSTFATSCGGNTPHTAASGASYKTMRYRWVSVSKSQQRTTSYSNRNTTTSSTYWPGDDAAGWWRPLY